MAALTFGGVGRRLGISDRTVVYYFPSKADLVSAVVGALVAELELLLEEAFGSEPLPAPELVRRAWPVLATGSTAPVFALFFEIVGLAMSGQPPYPDLAVSLLTGWVDWLEPRVLGEDHAERRNRAMATVAQVDGLLLVRQVLGSGAADGAARAAGVVGPS
jgi:AcrR family transcriptional regulator